MHEELGAEPTPGISQTIGYRAGSVWSDGICLGPTPACPWEMNSQIYCFALLVCEAFPLSTKWLYLNT